MTYKFYDVMIIGGGASGLACAVQLSKSGKNLKILLVEAGDRFGKKLAATGNGQGNVSNLDMAATHYHGGNRSLVQQIACADPFEGTGLFGCLFSADEKGRIYPAGRQASALSDDLIKTLKSYANVSLVSGSKVTDVKNTKDGFLITCGEEYIAHSVVLCTGGKAQKQFKTDGSSYVLATKLGHRLTELYPSLVQLKTQTKDIKTLKGIRTDCRVTAFCEGEKLAESRGDVIFTEYGVSGNAVFSISSYVADKHNATLNLEFLPDFSAKEILESISKRKKDGWATEELLSGTLHNQISRAIVKRTGSDLLQEIVKTLKNFTLPVTGTLGFDYAQVTKGGIRMDEVTDGLESKLVPNLYFAGEILDVDGDCGGYNLQWAFTSGIHVANEILKRVK